jgi:hypothetical protein
MYIFSIYIVLRGSQKTLSQNRFHANFFFNLTESHDKLNSDDWVTSRHFGFAATNHFSGGSTFPISTLGPTFPRKLDLCAQTVFPEFFFEWHFQWSLASLGFRRKKSFNTLHMIHSWCWRVRSKARAFYIRKSKIFLLKNSLGYSVALALQSIILGLDQELAWIITYVYIHMHVLMFICMNVHRYVVSQCFHILYNI